MWLRLNVLIVAFLGLASVVPGVFAAEPAAPPAGAGELWRKKPPALPPPRPFKPPSVAAFKLPNGLTVELVEDHRVPFVTVLLGIKAGSAFEPQPLLGLSDMTADLITEGTARRKSKEIASEVDFIGGGLRASSDYDYTLVTGSALSKYTGRLFDVMADVVLNPSFPEDELRLKKTNLIQELSMKRSQPDFLQDERFAKVLFGNHPYAVIAPTPESVERIAVKDLRDFHKRLYLPNEAVLIVVGDFKDTDMRTLIEKSFGEWKAGKLPLAQKTAPPVNHGRRIYLVDRPGSVQSAVKVGNLGISKKDQDYFTFLVSNQVLGGGSQARLFLNVREQKGYTYGAYSSFAARRDPGAFAAKADVRTDVTSPSLQEFLYELERLRNVRVSDKELEDAKRYLVGSFQLGLETQAGLAQKLLEQRMYDLPEDYLATFSDKIMGVSADDVRKAARKHIDTDDLTIVVVGDAKKVKPELEYFAPVQVFDASGKSVTRAATPAADSL